jgi:predicted permease
VEAASAITLIPYVNWGNNGNVRYEGQPADDPTRLPLVEYRSVSPEFFSVTRQRVIAGRLLRQQDDERPGSPPVVVVNQALVDRDFKGRDPVGQRFYVTDTSFATIVGVVSDIRNSGPIAAPKPEMYSTYRQGSLGTSNFPIMIRVRGDNPAAFASAVTTAIRGVDPTAAIGDVKTMSEVIAQSLGQPRFYFSLLGTFAAVAVALAIAGLYGVLSYAVAQRTREMGIRAALGSSRRTLMGLVTLEGLRLAGIGLALGLAGGAAVTRLMVFMLYGVSPLDAATWALSALLMIGAAVLAAIVPAIRAARVNPLVAIQSE